jgi:hypothetical protein
VIAGKSYSLRVHGKSVCPRAFAALHGISINTLSNIAKQELLLPIVEVTVRIVNYLLIPSLMIKLQKKVGYVHFSSI